MWIWGRLSIFALRRHIAREIKPLAVAQGVTREEAIEATCAKLREHFDSAWPDDADRMARGLSETHI